MAQVYRCTEYMCTYCGKKRAMVSKVGRPEPGECPRRSKMQDGKRYPHRWVINRKY